MPLRRPQRVGLLAMAMATAAGAAASPARAQYAAAANVGLSVVPITLGAVQLSVAGSVDRRVSWLAPRTVLALGTTATIGSPAAGFSLGVGAERTAEADSLPPVIAVRGGLWHTFGKLALRLDVTERALRMGGHDGGSLISPHWVDSLPLDSGMFAYHFPSTDTTVLPPTPSHLNYWPELEAGATWTSGRVMLEAALGGRTGVGTAPPALWGHAGATLQITHGLALAVATGVSPARIGLGIPASRYLSVGVHIAAVRAEDRVRIAPPPRTAEFVVRPLGAQRYTVSYTAAHLDGVELSGDFNGWTPIALREAGEVRDRWETTLTLARGVYHISLRTNGGAWFAPPGTPAVADDFGGTAGIVVVR